MCRAPPGPSRCAARLPRATARRQAHPRLFLRASATVQAVRDTWVWRLPKEAFERLAEQSPRTSLSLARLVARRALSGPRRLQTLPATLTLMPCGLARIDMRAFGEQLLRALASRRPVLLDHASFDRALGAGAADRTARLDEEANGVRLLEALEARHPLVIYVADPVDNAWTRRCIRQADRLLRIVSGDDPGLSEAEIDLAAAGRLRPTAREELVRLLPDNTTSPTGTAAWLTERAVDAHHHVRLGVSDDFGRLARLSAGRPVGVALSGGGARGMAHLGLLRALEEASIQVDLVAGTSAGAFIAAQYARGGGPEAIAERSIAMVRKGFFDPTLPMLSLLSGYRTRTLMARAFGDAQLEDVWRPCYVGANPLRVPLRGNSWVFSVRSSEFLM